MKISDLAVLVNGIVENGTDIDIVGLSGVARAKCNDLTFAMDETNLAIAEKSQTACVITTINIRKSSKTLIRVRNPKLAFLICYDALNPYRTRNSFIHSSADIASSVKIGDNVHIASHVAIEDNVTIGDNSVIESGCVIKKNSSIGNFCHLYPRVVLYENAVLKEHVTLHAGVVVGSDGFGYVKDKGVIHKFPQAGRVIIEDNVEIGANTSIDRGSLDDTIIGANSKIDNLCHIAHNVKIGRNLIMAAQCGIAGGTIIGDNVTMSGQIAVIDNVTIGDNVFIGGQSGIIGHIKSNAVVWGSPAKPLAQAKRQMAVLSWLTKNFPSVVNAVKEKAKEESL